MLVLAVLAWRLRDVPVVRWAAVTATAVWVLSLGERLHVAGSETDVPLPFARHRRAAGAGEPGRGAAVAVRRAAGGAGPGGRAGPAARERRAVRHRVRTGALVALCVVPLLPAWPYDFVDAGTPEYFTTAAVRGGAGGLGRADVPGAALPLQRADALAGRGRLPLPVVGGYVITPDEDGAGTFRGGVTDWERVVSQAPLGRLGAVAPQVVDALREEMAELDVRSVLVADVRGSDAVVRSSSRCSAPRTRRPAA